jgi:pyruvate dehydrogenase E2 component (dihydrolipoamide acetyltransferase)
MSNTVLLPKLGLTMEHGLIMGWSKKEGDAVKNGDILFQVESDKAVVDVESDFEGILLKRYFKEGDDVPCGTAVAAIGKKGEVPPDFASPVAEAPVAEAVTQSEEKAKSETQTKISGKVIASPRARRLAVKEGVDLGLIGSGSGDNGRIKERDVQAFIDSSMDKGMQKISPVAKNILENEQLSSKGIKGTGPDGRIMKRDVVDIMKRSGKDHELDGTSEVKIIPISPMRETIAKRLSASKSTIPHYYITISVDMTNFIEARKAWNEGNPEKKVSMNAMLMKVVAVALKKHPIVNASWSDEGLKLFSRANIALAVSTEKGLVTPVVRNCDLMTVLDIEEVLSDLIGRARTNQLKLEEFTGSTCTISNLGMYGVEEFSAIINPPEASILAIASIINTPMAQGQSVVVKPIMKITMSADHRVVDGAASAEFLRDLKKMLEYPFFALF